MKMQIAKSSLLGLVIFLCSQITMADPTQSIAQILVGLNHFPSDADKNSLMTISKDPSNSKAMQTIAISIHNIKHKASDEDKVALKMIVDDASSTDTERKLASIVMNVNHRLSAEDKAVLAALK